MLFLLCFLCHCFFLFTSDYWKKLSFNKKTLLYGISTLLIAFFFRINTNYVFSVVFAASSIFYALKQKKIYKPALFQLIFIGYFLIQVVSLFWSTNIPYGIRLLGHYSPLVASALLFSLFRLHRKDFDVIFLVLLRISIVFITISLCSWFLQARFMHFELLPDTLLKKFYGIAVLPYKLTFAWSDFFHPTYIGYVALFSLIIAWYYLFRADTENKIEIPEFIFLIFTMFLLFLYTGSRFIFLGWIIVNALGVLYLLRNHKIWFLAVFLLFFVIALFITIKYSDSIISFFTDPLRSAHYTAAFQSIKENTWHGTGIGGLTKYINYQYSAYVPLQLPPEFPHIHPHNQFLGDLMQTGIFGLSGIIMLVAYLFYISLKSKNWLLFAFLILSLFLMMIEMPLIYEKGALIFTVIVSLLMQWKKNEENITEV